jgi:hypothetical protein
MRRSVRLLLSYAVPGYRQAAAGQQLGACAAGVTTSSSATTLANGTRHLTSSALHRSAVLPRLLDTLSDTYQQSTQRMDGLLEQMTAELEKVCSKCCCCACHSSNEIACYQCLPSIQPCVRGTYPSSENVEAAAWGSKLCPTYPCTPLLCRVAKTLLPANRFPAPAVTQHSASVFLALYVAALIAADTRSWWQCCC